MKVGVFVATQTSAGGMYQYTLQVIRSLLLHRHEFETLVFETDVDETVERLCAPAGELVHLRSYQLLRALAARLPARGRSVRSRPAGGRLRRFMGKRVLGAAAARRGVDLMVFPTPCPEAAACGTHYVVAIHDIQHLLQPEFPEVSANGEVERRERIYKAAIANADAVLVDSSQSKQDVTHYYAADPGRVHPLPFVPAPNVNREVSQKEIDAVRAKYDLPPQYAFYPAQFWPHKNHLRLIEAVALVPELGLVLTGTEDVPFSTIAEVRRSMARLLPDRGRLLGYVPHEEVGPLFAGATMLAMPTFFGPTNIPIVEAFNLGIPVVASDLPGVKEQVGGAALLVAPRDVDGLARALERVLTDAGLRKDMVERGRHQGRAWTTEAFGRRLVEILREVASSRARRSA